MVDTADSTPHGTPFERLPSELHDQIDSYFATDYQTLHSLILVNKQWFTRVIGLLWKSAPIEALLSVYGWDEEHQEHRRQFYTRKICEVHLHRNFGRSKREILLLDLHFKSIQKLRIDASLLTSTWLSRFAQPTLQTIECFTDIQLTTDMLDALTKCCQLKKLVFRCTVTTCALDTFLQVLKNCRFVEFQKVLYFKDNTVDSFEVTSQVIMELLRRGRLESLLMDQFLRGQEADNIFESIKSHPLPANPCLRLLVFGGHSRIVKSLLSTATSSLIDLFLVVQDEKNSIHHYISGFPNLSVLCLSLRRHEYSLTRNELDAVAQLRHLTSLSLQATKDGICIFDVEWMTDDYFQVWIAHFPRLRFFSIDWMSSVVTEAAIAALGASCPNLKGCELFWEHDLSSWRHLGNAPIFRSLKELELGRVKPLDPGRLAEEVHEIADIILNIAPAIDEFDVSENEGDDSAAKLLKVVSSKIEDHRKG